MNESRENNTNEILPGNGPRPNKLAENQNFQQGFSGQKKRRSVGLDGMGSINGGEYDKVNIDGMGKQTGNIRCDEFNVNGMFKSKGRIVTNKLCVNGMLRAYGDIKAQEVEINGFMKVRGAGVYAKKVTVDGALTCTNELSGDEVVISGICSIAMVSGESIKILGNFEKPNLPQIFEAVEQIARLYIGRPVDSKSSIVDEIECTTLEANCLKAKRICAHDVYLGENCQVELLEYTGQCRIHETAVVKKIKGGNDVRGN